MIFWEQYSSLQTVILLNKVCDLLKARHGFAKFQPELMHLSEISENWFQKWIASTPFLKKYKLLGKESERYCSFKGEPKLILQKNNLTRKASGHLDLFRFVNLGL